MIERKAAVTIAITTCGKVSPSPGGCHVRGLGIGRWVAGICTRTTTFYSTSFSLRIMAGDRGGGSKRLVRIVIITS